MVRNFEEFKVGNYYIYTGCKGLPNWVSDDDMDFVLTHKPQLCEKTISMCSSKFANTNSILWNWKDGFDNWIEIEDPSGSYDLKIGEFYYDQKLNKVKQAFDTKFCSGNFNFALKRKEVKTEDMSPTYAAVNYAVNCAEGSSLKILLEEYEKELILSNKRVIELQEELLRLHKEKNELLWDKTQIQDKLITELIRNFNDSSN